jgi:predicted phage terminase large subunit-like protein
MLAAAKRVEARESLLGFMDYCYPTNKQFIKGWHTETVTARLDQAMRDLERGKSTYLLVQMPFRHGKSEIVSRYWPPHIFGQHPEIEFILATYASTLARQMSKAARGIMRSREYGEVFPEIRLDGTALEEWDIEGADGKFQALGFGGSATGKGAQVLVIDDYFKGREEAESETIRNKRWDALTDDLMSRLAPVHIMVVTATPWHTDDIAGRIENRMNPDHEDYDPDFPQFETLRFPAKSDDYETGYLWPERFPEEWYKRQFAIRPPYSVAGLLQCSPIIRGGSLLAVDNIRYYGGDGQPERPPGMPDDVSWVRFWDLASTEDERHPERPDATSGCKLCIWEDPDSGAGEDEKIYWIAIDDFRECRKEAPERNRLIKETAKVDGQRVPVGVESVAGYKDTYTIMSQILDGFTPVHKVNVSGDKVTRAEPLETACYWGRIWMRSATWNTRVVQQWGGFPGGKHDDDVDSASGAVELAKKINKQRAGLGNQFGRGAV